MVEFNPNQMTEEDLIEAANKIFTIQEKDFERIKSEKWYKTLFHAITLNQDGKKYAVRGINSLAKLQQLFMSIYVKNYRTSYKYLNETINVVTKNSEAIKKLFGMCVLNLEGQEDLGVLDPQDAEILALFLGEYRDANGAVPVAVQSYNRGVLNAIHQKVPIGALDNHQIRRLKAPKVVYRCFMEQCAVDGTIDSQEWTDQVYQDLRDFELSENSKNEIKQSVKYEAEIAGVEYFIVKYTKDNIGVLDSDFDIDIQSSIDPTDFEVRVAQENHEEKKRIEEAKKEARTFYQKSILVVSESDADLEAEYLLGLLNETKNMIDPSLPAPTRVTMKTYLKDRTDYESKGMHIIMLGNSHESKKLHKVARSGHWDYDNHGLRFVSFGNKTAISVRDLKNKEINSFIELAKETAQKHKIIIPQNVKTVKFTFMKEVFSGPEDGIVNVLTGIVCLPLIVVGQTLENVENGWQAVENMSAKKKLTYLQYCIAIIKYLESQHALIDQDF